MTEGDQASVVGVFEDGDVVQSDNRRGWWDYVPSSSPYEKQANPQSRPEENVKACPKGRFRRWLYGDPVLPSTVFQPHESMAPPPQGAVRTSTLSNTPPSRVSANYEPEYPRAGSPPPPSVMDRIIRYVPRADLLRNMLKNEVSTLILHAYNILLIRANNSFYTRP